MTWPQLLTSSFMGFLGGFIATFIVVRSSNKGRKWERQQQIKNEFIKLTDTIEDSFKYLENFVNDDGLMITKEKKLRKIYYDTIVDVGNTFEWIAYLYYCSDIDKDFTDGPIREAIQRFYELCHLKKFKVSSFSNLNESRNWNKTWIHIESYLSKNRAKWPAFRAFIFG